MAKRSNFVRRARDFYPTPEAAVLPLFPHISKRTTFMEPCAGDGQLVDILSAHELLMAYDIEPKRDDILCRDALEYVPRILPCFFITNPPWPSPGSQGEPVISMAVHLSDMAPTWFLLSADFAHNKYFSKVADRCRKIVSVGRVSWMENGTGGKDNAAWYLFDKPSDAPTVFYGRSP